jgi:hypothetical protein
MTGSVSDKIGFQIPLIASCIPSGAWLVSLASFKIDFGRPDMAAKNDDTHEHFTKRKINNIKERK